MDIVATLNGAIVNCKTSPNTTAHTANTNPRMAFTAAVGLALGARWCMMAPTCDPRIAPTMKDNSGAPTPMRRITMMVREAPIRDAAAAMASTVNFTPADASSVSSALRSDLGDVYGFCDSELTTMSH